MSARIKILIADDHNLVRQSLAMALATDESLEIVGQAENGKVLLDLLENMVVDVIILDLDMPVMNGWDVLPILKNKFPACKVIIVSMHFEGLLLKDLVSRGAHGFLPKNSDFETLINAVHEVLALGFFFSKQFSTSIVHELLNTHDDKPYINSDLNEKERQVLIRICDDKSSREIASELNMSERTLERYKTSIYTKTKAKTTAGLVLYALRHNIYSLLR